MNRYLLLVVVALSATTFSYSAAVAQDNYVVPAFVYTDDDKSRLVDDEVAGGQLTVGRYFGNHFALEGFAGYSSLGGADNLDLREFGANALLGVGRQHRFAPYVILGFGGLDAKSTLFSDESNAFTTYGAGLNLRLTDRAALRIEHRERDISESNLDIKDKVTSLGLSFAFGARDMPPAPPPAPADPDSDGDGVNDSRDACPNTPAGYRVDARGCPLDSDGDGVIDNDDQCPNTFRGADVDARGCELDDDKDGVVNRLDRCPNTTAGVRVDVNGCEIRDVIDLPGVTFETNSDRLLPGADRVLQDAAATLRRYPDLVVEVAGHTDSQGDAAYNQGLSERRAATVRDYLINAGVAEANLTLRGYGEAMPVADNSTAIGRAANRRVELRLIED